MGEGVHDTFVPIDTDKNKGEDRHIDRDVGNEGAEFTHEWWESPVLQYDSLNI